MNEIEKLLTDLAVNVYSTNSVKIMRAARLNTKNNVRLNSAQALVMMKLLPHKRGIHLESEFKQPISSLKIRGYIFGVESDVTGANGKPRIAWVLTTKGVEAIVEFLDGLKKVINKAKKKIKDAN